MTSNRGVFVRVFDNLTDETGAEMIFTNALIHELQTSGEIVVKEDSENAVRLSGVLTKITYTPTASFGGDARRGLQPWVVLPSILGVTVTLTITLTDPKNEYPPFSKGFSGFQRVGISSNRTYDVESPSAYGPIAQSSVESTFPDIARTIMRDVYDDLVELF